MRKPHSKQQQSPDPRAKDPHAEPAHAEPARIHPCKQHTHGDVCGDCGYGMPRGTFDGEDFAGYCD